MIVSQTTVGSTVIHGNRHYRTKSHLGFATCLLSLLFSMQAVCLAQPGIKELPVIDRPRERETSKPVVIRSVPAQPTKGVLAVVLDPIINGKVVIKDLNGRVLSSSDAGENGQAEFQLQRRKVYQIEVSSPGFVAASGKTKPLGATEILRLKLIPQFATIRLRGLPPNSQVLIDDSQRATADQSGIATISDVQPGDHKLLIRHTEHNDYADKLESLEAGLTYNYTIRLAKVAKLSIQSLPNATVMIDGAFQGRVERNGSVQIDFVLEQAGEHTVSVELVGYQTWSARQLLSPGPRSITVKLDPIITSAGFSDFFNNLNQWNAPSSWKIISQGRNMKVEVNGSQLGAIKDVIYRDFQANVTVWFGDGKGATWAVRADKEGRNYYLFHISGPKSTTHTPNYFYTYQVKDGGEPSEMATPVPVLIDLTQPGSYTITATAQEYTIKQKIVGNQSGEDSDLGSWTDTSDTKDKFLYGTFGFRSFSGEVFTADDLHIEPIKPIKP